jgi:hypothetical protein
MAITITTIYPTGRASSSLSPGPLSFAAKSQAANAGGDTWVGTGKECLAVKNAGASQITVTLVFGYQATADQQIPANQFFSVNPGDLVIAGPFPLALFGDVNNQINVKYSSVTSVSVMLTTPATK